MKKTVDLVVIGSASSGLSCAVKARQLGVESVLVLEKMPNTGGCSKFAGQISGFDTPVQKRQGLYYSADTAFKDLINVLNWYCDAKLVRKWITGTGENIRWLEDEVGVVFSSVNAMNDRPDINRLTMHNVPREPGAGKHTGYRIIEALLNQCDRLGIEVLVNTPARHLIKDEASGAITGVTAEMENGETLTVNAKAVMLATGSISGSKEMIKRFLIAQGLEELAVMSGFPHNTGDGIVMAEEVGGAPGKVSTVFIGPHNHFKGASEIVGTVTRRPHGIKINKHGERFVDESICSWSEFGWMMSANIDRQPGKMSWTVIDQSLLEHMKATRKDKQYLVDFGAIRGNEIVTFGETEEVDQNDLTAWILHFDKCVRKEEAEGRAKVCGSIAEMAEYIGCPADVLEKTMADYNADCERGYDNDFLKSPEFLFPLDTPPYYVLNGPSGLDSLVGGLTIDNHQRVLDKDGMPLPGLYAGGVLTSGWLSGLYGFFGSEMSYCVFSGRNAAGEISEFIKK